MQSQSQTQSPKLYQILWKHPNVKKPRQFYVLELVDFINVCFPTLFRDQVVSTDKSKLEKTIEYLKSCSADDEEFFIVEKKVDYD